MATALLQTAVGLCDAQLQLDLSMDREKLLTWVLKSNTHF